MQKKNVTILLDALTIITMQTEDTRTPFKPISRSRMINIAAEALDIYYKERDKDEKETKSKNGA